MSLSLWLRQGRSERGLSLEDVARITKIQPRILERLEGGKLEGLPAEVFVRGFIRSVAKCCGLDEAEALSRYAAASAAEAQSPSAPAPAARAVVEAMSDLAPRTAARVTPSAPMPVVAPVVIEEPIAAPVAAPVIAAPVIAAPIAAPVIAAPIPEPVVEATGSMAVAAPTTSKKKRRDKKRTTKRKSMAHGTPSAPLPVVRESAAIESAPIGAVESPTANSIATSSPADSIATMPDASMPDASMPVVSMPVASMPAVESTVLESMSVGESMSISDAVSMSISDATPVGESMSVGESVSVGESMSVGESSVDVVVDQLDPLVVPTDDEEVVATSTWQPKMPAVVTTPSVPWRRPAASYLGNSTSAASVPSLVIDDADPEGAESVLEEREAARSVLTAAQRRSFLPPILLDREDRGARQGGLTLAVIILLIAATLTLSYLMRRPSSSGDGVTLRGTPTQSTQLA